MSPSSSSSHARQLRAAQSRTASPLRTPPRLDSSLASASRRMEHRRMNQADLPVLFKELRKLCAAFNRTFTEELGEVFAIALADEPIESVVALAREAAKGDAMPLPKELMAGLADAEGELAATTAWEATRPCFAHSSEPSEPIAAEVVRLLGGSAAIAQRASDDVAVWVRRDFIRL